MLPKAFFTVVAIAVINSQDILKAAETKSPFICPFLCIPVGKCPFNFGFMPLTSKQKVNKIMYIPVYICATSTF